MHTILNIKYRRCSYKIYTANMCIEINIKYRRCSYKIYSASMCIECAGNVSTVFMESSPAIMGVHWGPHPKIDCLGGVAVQCVHRNCRQRNTIKECKKPKKKGVYNFKHQISSGFFFKCTVQMCVQKLPAMFQQCNAINELRSSCLSSVKPWIRYIQYSLTVNIHTISNIKYRSYVPHAPI